AEPLPRRTAVHVYERRQRLARRDVARAVQEGGNPLSVERLIPDVLRAHEDLAVDRTVLRLDERLGGIGPEVVRDQRGTRDVRRVVDEQLGVVREELRAKCESGRQLELARCAGVDVIENRPDLRLLLTDGDQPLAV